MQENADVIHEPLTFVVLFTSDEVPNDLIFSRTVIDHKKGLVYHVFIKYQ